jgi:putative iron-only hydrogenase system regulator
MNKRIGTVSILIEHATPEVVAKVNSLVSDYSHLVVGRMGIPYRERDVSIISLIVEGDNDQIGALTGKLGQIPNVITKSLLLTR